MYMSLLIILLPLLASADTKPFLAALEVFTLGTGGVGRFLALALVTRASVLHHRNKRCSFVCVDGSFGKIGVDYIRLKPSITISVISILEFKGSAKGVYNLVKVAFLVLRLCLHGVFDEKCRKHVSSSAVFKKKNLPY